MVDALSKGAGIIDGLIVGNYYTSDSLAAVGIASPMFDVERYIAKKMAASKDAAETGLGLRIIGGLAEDIRYFHSLDNNNVIIRSPNH